FVWNIYCDWYVELSKPLLTGPDGSSKDETRATAAWALDEILKLLHPFMPFITEELWAVMPVAVIEPTSGTHGTSPSPLEGGGREGGKPQAPDSRTPPSPSPPRKGGERSSLLVLSEWPTYENLDAPDAEAEIGWLIDLVT